MTVGLFIPCYVDQFYPNVAIATLELLEKHGVDVVFPLKQTCCGGGSRKKFIHPGTLVVVSLHEPHPKPEIKEYALEIIINYLKEEGKL